MATFTEAYGKIVKSYELLAEAGEELSQLNEDPEFMEKLKVATVTLARVYEEVN